MPSLLLPAVSSQVSSRCLLAVASEAGSAEWCGAGGRNRNSPNGVIDREHSRSRTHLAPRPQAAVFLSCESAVTSPRTSAHPEPRKCNIIGARDYAARQACCNAAVRIGGCLLAAFPRHLRPARPFAPLRVRYGEKGYAVWKQHSLWPVSH